MRMLRTAMFWMHLATGLTIAVVVLVMSVTGVLLTYQRQIQSWADTRGLDAGPPAPGAEPLDPETLLASVRGQSSGLITAVRWRRDAAAPVEFDRGRTVTLYANGYTGELLGSGSARTRAFFRAVTDLHRWLGLNDDQPTGRAITGAANLAFLFMVLSGIYLWWPRNPSARAFRAVLLFRRGLRAKARDFNWHNVIGFWSAVPLLVIVGSAAVISYAWAGALVERAAGSSVPVRATAQVVEIPPLPDGRELAFGALLLERTRGLVRDWNTITLQLPVRDHRARFIVDAGTGGQPQKQIRLTLAAATGEVIVREPFASGSRAARLRSILRYAHTGEVLGFAGQTIAGLVSAGAALLAFTGVSLALRRFAAWRRRRRRSAVAVPHETVA